MPPVWAAFSRWGYVRGMQIFAAQLVLMQEEGHQYYVPRL
jgi:hypothetical protein